MTAGTVLTIEGHLLRYFTAGGVIDGELTEGLLNYDRSDDRALGPSPRVRRVLPMWFRGTPFSFHVLHWSDGSDLERLDAAVRRGDATDEAFAGALLAEPITVICGACGSHNRVLAVDPGQVLFASTLPERLRAHETGATCPGCGERIGGIVLELLDDTDADADADTAPGLRIGEPGEILEGEEAGRFVEVLDDAGNSGGFLIVTSADRDRGPDSFDSWVGSIAAVERFFTESCWVVRWTSDGTLWSPPDAASGTSTDAGPVRG